MSVFLYDDALIEKLKGWTKKTKVKIIGPDQSTNRIFSITADRTEDKPIKLPFISLTRDAGYTITNPNKKVLTYDGAMLEADELKSVSLNAIPITIPYQLDVYTRYRKEADLIVRDLAFNIINHPTLEVIIPHNDINFSHTANIRFDGNIADNSGVAERLVPDQFVRMTINLNIDDAYLWSAKIRDNVYIEDVADIELIQELR